MKVPVLQGPRVETRGLDTRTSSTSVGNVAAPVVEGFQEATRGASKGLEAYAKAKREADDYRLDQADLKAGRKVNERLYNKDTGFLNQQGEAALDNAPVLEALEQDLQGIEDELGDEELKRRFRLRRQARKDQAWTATERHSHRERLNVYGQVAEGQVALSLETASQAATKEEIDSAVSKVLVGPEGEPGPFRRWLNAQGLPVEKMEAEEKALRAKAYSTALTARLGQEDGGAGARALFEEVKGELASEVAKDFEGRIAAAEDKVLAERVTTEAVAAAKHPISGRVDPEAARKALEQVPEPKRARVAQRLEAELRAEEDNWAARVRGYYDPALTAYLKRKRLSDIPSETEQWLRSHAPAKWRDLEQMAQSDADRFRARREGREGTSDADVLVELEHEMANNRGVYSAMSLDEFREKWRHRLSDRGFKVAGSAFAILQKQDRIAEAKGYLADDEEIRNTAVARAAENGITKKEELASFRRYVEGWLAEWRSKNNELKPPRSEVEKAIAIGLTQGKVKKNWRPDPTRRRFQAKQGEEFYTEGAEDAPPSAAPPPAPKPAAGVSPSAGASDMVTVVRKRDGKEKRVPRAQAARFAADPNFEVR